MEKELIEAYGKGVFTETVETVFKSYTSSSFCGFHVKDSAVVGSSGWGGACHAGTKSVVGAFTSDYVVTCIKRPPAGKEALFAKYYTWLFNDSPFKSMFPIKIVDHIYTQGIPLDLNHYGAKVLIAEQLIRLPFSEFAHLLEGADQLATLLNSNYLLGLVLAYVLQPIYNADQDTMSVSSYYYSYNTVGTPKSSHWPFPSIVYNSATFKALEATTEEQVNGRCLADKRLLYKVYKGWGMSCCEILQPRGLSTAANTIQGWFSSIPVKLNGPVKPVEDGKVPYKFLWKAAVDDFLVVNQQNQAVAGGPATRTNHKMFLNLAELQRFLA